MRVLSALILLVTGCAYYPSMEIVGGARRVDGVMSPGACAIVRQQINERQGFYYIHCSDPTAGQPFNTDFDVSDDVVGYGIKFGGGKRR